MTRTESHLVIVDSLERPLREAVVVCGILIAFSFLVHYPSLFRPGEFVMSPADLLLRQPELGGSPEYVPINRLLIDPVLQFEPWEQWIRQESIAGRFAWWNPWSGTGAPLAANGQSRMFDPLAWLFRAWPGGTSVAAESSARFVLCGMGMWLLAFEMGGGPWVRAWSAVTVPLTGFFTLWRIFPLASAATVLPWLWAMSLRLRSMPSIRQFALTSLAVAWVVVAGNVQVAAVGFCGTAALQACRAAGLWAKRAIRITAIQTGALVCGLVIALPAWAGLLDYLDRSPVWVDRHAEHSGTGRGAKARWADLPCVVFPFIYGSERRGDANVARAVGATNVNEAASGHVGLIAAVALIPLGIRIRSHHRTLLTDWALAMTIVGLWIGYRLPPVNLAWHRLPVFSGIDPRRFAILATFGGTLLASNGLRAIAAGEIGQRFDKLAPRIWWIIAVGCYMVAVLPLFVSGKLEAQARRHYEASVPSGPEHARIVAARVADQMTGLTGAWPAYLASRAAWLAALALAWRCTRHLPGRRAIVIGSLAIAELVSFGWGYVPQIHAGELANSLDLRLIRTMADLDADARAKGHESRFLAVGECLPPNQLMRFGLKDLRNYDSIELLATLEGLESLFEPEADADRSSRRTITWNGVGRASKALRDMGVIGVVGLTKPPTGLFEEIREPIPGVFLGIWRSVPKVGGPARLMESEGGAMRIRLTKPSEPIPDEPRLLKIRESYDPGWRVSGDDEQFVKFEPEPGSGMMLCLISPEKQGDELRLSYRPLWFDRSIAPATLAGSMCLAGIVIPFGQLRKRANSYFSGRRKGG